MNNRASESIYLIREAAWRYRRIGVLWSMGKDSTALVWLCRQAFLGRLPGPVIHIDTGYKFPQMYEFRDRVAREWGLDLIVWRNRAAIAEGMGPRGDGGRMACCGALKTTALRQALTELKLDAVLVGIRRDEHGIRAKERYFSPRDESSRWHVDRQPLELHGLPQGEHGADHHRIHPLLHFTELDVWQYTLEQQLPVNPLYFSRNGQRYRSLGCMPCCAPVSSEASTVEEIVAELRTTNVGERSGRAQDKESEHAMQKLRSLGYL